MSVKRVLGLVMIGFIVMLVACGGKYSDLVNIPWVLALIVAAAFSLRCIECSRAAMLLTVEGRKAAAGSYPDGTWFDSRAAHFDSTGVVACARAALVPSSFGSLGGLHVRRSLGRKRALLPTVRSMRAGLGLT